MMDGLHEHARRVLIGRADEQLVPFFHIQFKDRPDAIMPAPFTDERSKSAFIQAIRMAMKEFRRSVVNYAFISEAWVAEQTGRPGAADRPPSEREDRRECVIVSAGDKDRAAMRMWEIVRDDQARVIDLVEDKAYSPDQFEGRLHNLLADDDP